MLLHLTSLMDDPLSFIINLLYLIPAILVSLTLHELSHGYVALRCGDPTAQMLGRLSFNPMRHLDPIGTASMLLIGIGWAKPVPVNPRNYKNFKRDDILVSGAGIAMNLLLFFVGTVLAVLCARLMLTDDILSQIGGSRLFMRASMFAPETVGEILLDWSRRTDILQRAWLQYPYRFLNVFCQVNASLAIFNFLPVPPLDGYHIFNDILFGGRIRITRRVMQVVLIAFLVINFATDWISTVIYYAVTGLQNAALFVVLPLFGMA